MIHRGRQRHKTHGGIPHGSTLNFGAGLQIYYRHKEGITSESITTTQEDDSTSTTTNVSAWADQSTNENNQRFKTGAGTTIVRFNTDGGVQTPNDEKSLVMVERTNGSTGTIMGYKNGLQIDSSVTNAAQFDVKNLGSKNDTANYFDGKIYDIGIIEGTVTADYRNRIVDHLLSKHGLERLA